MLDLETLGTTADSAIISIGAVRFDLESSEVDNDGFYASVSVDSNLELGRKISESTLIWWMGQDEDAKCVFTEPKQTLYAALQSLSDWFGGEDDYLVWSNGASFDIPMLEHAYAQADMEVPWKFFNARCMRTYKNLPGAAKFALPFKGVAHNALHDALNQAQSLQAIHTNLFKQRELV